MLRLLCLSIVVLSCACESNATRAVQSTPPSGPTLTLATYNLYLGADLMPLLTTVGDRADVEAAVARTFEAVRATDPHARADAVAAELAALAPDVVTLQEVALWRTQTPADGSATPAETVAYDFLRDLLDALARRSLLYTEAVTATHTDVEATGDFAGAPMDVRFTDRDSILVKVGSPLRLTGTDQATFIAALVVPTDVVGTLKIPRGWIAVDATLDGRALRIVDTHLEAAAAPIRDAQAAELLAGPGTSSPLVLAGDFNFAPGSLPYDTFDAAGLVDQWTVARPDDPGPTCCQAGDLRNASSQLDERIDLVWTRGGLGASAAGRLGADPSTRTGSGLWPSDHAGVEVTLALP
jgi:endonuclease/exonuclease/phosphatase family metal-dependent hydrolase